MRSFIYISWLLLGVLWGCKSMKPKKAVAEPVTASAAAPPMASSTPNSVSRIAGSYLVKDSSNIHIYLVIDFDPRVLPSPTFADIEKRYKLLWSLNADTGLREKIKNGRAEITPENARIEKQLLYVAFDVPRAAEYDRGTVFVDMVEQAAGKRYAADFSVLLKTQRFSRQFGLFKKGDKAPEFQPYLVADQPFSYQSVVPVQRPFYLLRLDAAFKPARSPMSTRPRPELTKLSWTNARVFQTGEEITLTEPGLYFAVLDTNQLQNGSPLLIVNNRFPRLTRPAELVQAMTYISTNTEIDSLTQSFNAKQALDSQLLKLTQANQSEARQLVQAYFRRITEANELFTTYKEGWKTDQGMVYVVLGPPYKIQRMRDREVWQYAASGNFSEVIFTFYKKSNQLIDDAFELVRYADYSQYWYPYVEAWRNVKVTITE